MTQERFHHAPPSQQVPAFITTNVNSNSVPDDILDDMNNLLNSVGCLTIENTAMKRYLVKKGLWKKFLKYFSWEYDPDPATT